MKLIIGTSNFGNLYGLKKKRLNIKEIFKIVSLAKKKGISHYDTAKDYRNSELFLGRCFKKIYKNDRLVVDTKLPKNLEKNNLENKIEKIVKDSIKKLQIKKINILYIHDSSQLYKKSGKKIYNQILSLKKKKFISKIGISVYTIKEAKKILLDFNFDVIQAPLNIIDKRFIKEDFLKFLKKRKCLLIARSIFLKGLLTNSSFLKKNYFKKWTKKIDLVEKKLQSDKRTIKMWTLHYLNKHNFLKSYILGISKAAQLTEILKILSTKQKNLKEYKELNIEEQKLINPKYWPNN